MPTVCSLIDHSVAVNNFSRLIANLDEASALIRK